MQNNFEDLFSTAPLDRLEEIYVKTMERMDDATLKAYCSTVKYNKNLCNDNFWLRRIKENNLELLLPYRSLYPSLQSFYFNVRKDACYVIAFIEDNIIFEVSAFNDITKAMTDFAYIVNEENGNPYTGEQDIDYTNLFSDTQIYIMFDYAVIPEQILPLYSIFNLLKSSPNYLNPNITKYPLLSHNHEVLFCLNPTMNDQSFSVVILPFDDKHLRLVSENASMCYLLTDTATSTQPTEWEKVPLGILRYLQTSDDVALIIDTALINNISNEAISASLLRFNAIDQQKRDHVIILTTDNVYKTSANIYRTILENLENKDISQTIILASFIEGLILTNNLRPLAEIKNIV